MKTSKNKKYDFFFSPTALGQSAADFEEKGQEKTRMYWRGYEFTMFVEHKREFDPFWKDYEYVGSGLGDEISVEKMTKKDVKKIINNSN